MNFSYINSDDPRIVKTIKSIYDAFLDCMKETSYGKINIKMICEAANINRSTFYAYYESKDHLFKCIMKDVVESSNRLAMENYNHLDERIPKEALCSIADFRFVLGEIFYGKNDFSLVPLFHDAIAEDLYNKMMIHFNGRRYSPHDLDIVIRFYTGAIASLLAWWVANENSISFERLQERFKILMRPLHEQCDLTLLPEDTE